MCVFKTPKAMAPVIAPEVRTIETSTSIDSGAVEAQSARTSERKKRIAAGASNTLITGGEGLTTQPATTTKTLFGQ